MRYLRFLAIGVIVAATEEFLTVVVLRGDLLAFLLAIFLLFPIFLTISYFVGRRLDRADIADPRREVIYLVLLGMLGLMVEWFLIGLSPWSNPDAPAVLMCGFQFGMFSFWAGVAYLPRLFSQPEAQRAAIRGSILRFLLPYFLLVYLAAFTIPQPLKSWLVIILIIFGFEFLHLFYLRYFLYLSRPVTVSGRPMNSP